MDDMDSKIANLQAELRELEAVIHALGRRLGAGENAVRAELNPAIRRAGALRMELHALEVASGRLQEEEPEPLYGPPSVFSAASARAGDMAGTEVERPRSPFRRLLGLFHRK